MSFSELYRRANREESTRPKNNIVSSDLSFMPSNDLVELVWENGQILMQGQSSRSGKTSNSDTFKSRGSDFPLMEPSCEIGAGHDDDMIRWLNFHINDDSMEQAYCSDLLTGLSGVTEHEISASQTEKSFPFYRSRVSDLTSNDTSSCTQSSVCADLTRVQTSSTEKLQSHDMGLPISSSGLLNFSHFSQFPSMRKTNIHKNGPSPLSIADKDKSAVTESSTGLCNRMSSNTQINTTPNNVREKSSYSKPVKEHLAVDESNVLCHVSTSTNDRPENVEGANEAAVVSSSICSASIVDRVSNDHKCDLKRKFRDTEESDSLSDDMEEQSISGKKVGPPRGGSGSKRSRAAEVHNLSERRRRDRINEKMRSLQELIPNCNKVDKASMLDEAIEYLKSLQLQVQVMSMGAARYMPQMMLPIGMQHMYASHMRQFSPMSVGTGMGFSSSPGYPIMQMPSRLGAQFCSPPSNLQMFGFNGQGWPHAPVASFSLGPPSKSATGSSSSMVGNLNSTQVSSSKDAI